MLSLQLQVVVGRNAAAAVSAASASTDASASLLGDVPAVPVPDAPPSLLIAGPVDASNVTTTDPVEHSLAMPDRMTEQLVVRPSTPIGPIIPTNAASDSSSVQAEAGVGDTDVPASPASGHRMERANVNPLNNINGMINNGPASVPIAAEAVNSPPPETQGPTTQRVDATPAEALHALTVPERMTEQPVVRPTTPIGPTALLTEGPSDLLAMSSVDSSSLVAEAGVADGDIATSPVSSPIVDSGNVSPLTLTDDAGSVATAPVADQVAPTPAINVEAAPSSAVEALASIARSMSPPPELSTSSGDGVTLEAAIASSNDTVVLSSAADEAARLHIEDRDVDSATVLPLTVLNDVSISSLVAAGSIADQAVINGGHEAITPSAAVEALASIFSPTSQALQTVSVNGADASSIARPAVTLPLVPVGLSGDETFAASTDGPSIGSLITQAATSELTTSIDRTSGLSIDEPALPETRGVSPLSVMTHDYGTMAIEMDAPASPPPLAPSVHRPFTATHEEAQRALASASPMLDIAVNSEAPQDPFLAGPTGLASSSSRSSPLASPRSPTNFAEPQAEERAASPDALHPPTLALPSTEVAIGGVSIDVLEAVAPSPGLPNAEAFTDSPHGTARSSPRSSPAASPLSAFTRILSPEREQDFEQRASAIPIADSLIVSSASGPAASPPPVLADAVDLPPASEPSQELDAGLLTSSSIISPDVAVQRLPAPSPPLSPTALTGAFDSAAVQTTATAAHLQGTTIHQEAVQLLLSSTATLNMQEPRIPSPPLATGTESRSVSPARDAIGAIGGPAHVAISLDAVASAGEVSSEGPLVQMSPSPLHMRTEPVQHVVLLTAEGRGDRATAGVARETDAHVPIIMQGLVQDEVGGSICREHKYDD